MNVRDEEWEPVARSTREALRLLGYPIEPRCLPGEAAPCGATFAQHAMAHLAVIKAICDHQLMHLGARFQDGAQDIYIDHLADLDRQCPHDLFR